MSETNGYVDKAALFNAPKRRYADVEIADVGTFRIRSLTEREQSEYEVSILDQQGKPKKARLVEGKVRLIVLCLCDAEGLQLMSIGDAAALGGVDSRITAELYEKCQAHCGISEDDVEELVGN